METKKELARNLFEELNPLIDKYVEFFGLQDEKEIVIQGDSKKFIVKNCEIEESETSIRLLVIEDYEKGIIGVIPLVGNSAAGLSRSELNFIEEFVKELRKSFEIGIADSVILQIGKLDVSENQIEKIMKIAREIVESNFGENFERIFKLIEKLS